MLLYQAVEGLKTYFQLETVSNIYQTGAWGGVAKGEFLNQVAVILTDKNPEEVLEIIQAIEAKLGRIREEHWGDRTMDIDILYVGDSVVETELLQIPHPFISERKFVLVPLAEILPHRVHPVTGKDSLEMLAECADLSEVWVFEKKA